MAFIDKKTVLEGAIYIYRRDAEGGKHQSQNWYANLKIPNVGTVRLSLKTPIESEAINKAQELYFEKCQRANRGLALSPTLFKKVAKDFIEDFEKQVAIWKELDSVGRSNMEGISANRLKNTKPIIKNYLIPFFGEKPIQEITEHDVESFKNFRLGYWLDSQRKKEECITYERQGRKVTRPKRRAEKSVPSYTTINKELTALRKVFTFARKARLISESDIPTVKRMQKPSGYDENRERPTFTKEQYTHLLNSITQTIKEQSNPKHRIAQVRLYLYVQLLSFTGMRVTEAKNLRFCDIETRNSGQDDEHLVLWVSGKNKKRDLVPFPPTSMVIENFRQLHQRTSAKHGWDFDENTYVLNDERGNRINSFSTTLTNALKKCGLLYGENGVRRSASCFRSFYITSALVSGKMTHIQLARNCGTSVAVIEKHYNRMSPSNFPEKFDFSNVATDTYFDHLIENLDKEKQKLAMDGVKLTITRKGFPKN